MNAALHYRQAAASFPKPTPAEEKILGQVGTISLRQTTRDFVHRSEPALAMFDRGAMLPECDWGPPSVREFESQTQLATSLYWLSKVAGLRIRHAFQQQNARAAVDDLLKLLKVARHVGRSGTFLFKILQFGVEGVGVDVAAAHLPGQDPAALEVLARGLETLPDAGTLSDTLQREKQFVLHYIPWLVEQKTFSEVAAMLRETYPEQEVRAILQAAGDAKGLLQLTEAWATLMDELGASLMVPVEHRHAALAAFAERHRAANPLVVPFVRQTQNVAYAAARAAARLAMLGAAVAIVRDGAEKYHVLTDAGSGGPFDFCRFRGGFELRAHLPFPGRPPASVVVGQNRGLGQALRRFLHQFMAWKPGNRKPGFS